MQNLTIRFFIFRKNNDENGQKQRIPTIWGTISIFKSENEENTVISRKIITKRIDLYDF